MRRNLNFVSRNRISIFKNKYIRCIYSLTLKKKSNFPSIYEAIFNSSVTFGDQCVSSVYINKYLYVYLSPFQNNGNVTDYTNCLIALFVFIRNLRLQVRFSLSADIFRINFKRCRWFVWNWKCIYRNNCNIRNYSILIAFCRLPKKINVLHRETYIL